MHAWKDIVDESAHQILSYDLLFTPFYHFPSTADPPTCTTLMQPSTRLVQLPSTIPYTHHTIGPAPHCRFGIWPTDHTVLFPIFSFFSVTWCVLLWASWSQVITLCSQDFIMCFTAHRPCAHFTYLRLLYLLQKTRKLSPEFKLSAFCLIVSPHSTMYLHPILHFWLALHYHTIPYPHFASSCTPWYHTRRPSPTPRSHPQSPIGFTLRLHTPSILAAC